MADKQLEEYRAYYNARAERYANNPKQQHSYEAECKMRDLFYKYDTLDEIKQHFGSLNIECAFAKWLDQYEMESEYYESVQDPIRKKCADDILSEIEKYPKSALSNQSIIDMSGIITEVTNRSNDEVYYDETGGKTLIEEWKSIDEIAIYENAAVPQKYKSEMQRIANDIKKQIRERIALNEEKFETWTNGKHIEPELVNEPRYRRLVPFSDSEIDSHLKKYNEIIKG